MTKTLSFSKFSTHVLMAATALLLFSGMAAQADDIPGAHHITREKAIEVAAERGYTDVRKVEFDDGDWEIDAVAADGRKVEIDIDGTSGKVKQIDYED